MIHNPKLRDGFPDFTTDIVEFLTARLDEDEVTAHYSGPARVAWLTYLDEAGQMRYTTVASGGGDVPWVADGHELDEPSWTRVIYDPARVLREVAAKRAIVAEHAPVQTDESVRHYRCGVCDPGCQCYPGGEGFGICNTIRIMAAVYADHPDYDPAWQS